MNIRELYPQYNEEQLAEAEENLRAYVKLALRIYQRIQQDTLLYQQLQASLTAKKTRAIRLNAGKEEVPPHPPT